MQENNVDQLAEAIEYMFENREQWEKYSVLARHKVETYFNQETQLALQAQYYDELLGGRA